MTCTPESAAWDSRISGPHPEVEELGEDPQPAEMATSTTAARRDLTRAFCQGRSEPLLSAG